MPDFVEMPDTIWTIISRARREGGRALDDLLRQYRPPIAAFIRNAGFNPDEAEDVVQEAFLTLIRDDVLSKADQSRGKFRSLLLAVVRHTIARKRRHDAELKHGGDRTKISLDAPRGDPDAPKLEDLLASPESDETFDTLWIDNLVRIGMAALKEECGREGTPYFEALLLHTEQGLDLAALADRLGASLTNVKNYLHQARLRLKRRILKEVQAYSSSRTEYESEVAYLMKFLE